MAGADLDYYRILQVHEEAEPEVIEAAYRRLSRMYHPDVNKDSTARLRMQQLNLAHDVLSNPMKRREYDRRRAFTRSSSGSGTRAGRQQAAREEAARAQAAREQTAREQAKAQAAREQTAREQAKTRAAREQAAREQAKTRAAREQAAREQAAATQRAPASSAPFRPPRRALLVLTAVPLILGAAFFWLGQGDQQDQQDRQDRQVTGRSGEYEKVTSLRAGYNLEKFKEQLGSPLFVKAIRKAAGLTENTFRGPHYWVNAISDRAGAVVQLAVTSCDREFQPTFGFGKGGSSEGSVTLNTTKMPAMDHLVRLNAEYMMPGNTANNYMFDVFYGASPGGYKTYAWGINDACPDFWVDQRRMALARATSSYEGPIANASPLMKEAREHVIVNTYVETAPGVQIVHGDSGQIGVDKYLVRTAG